MKRWKPYLSAFRVRALLETQYRAAAIGGMVTQVFFGLVMIFLYEALFEGGDAQAFADVVTYVWLQQMLFRALFSSEGELMQQIRDGSVAYTLIRPVDQQLWWLSRNLALKVVGCLMRLVPMLLVQLVLPVRYRVQGPCSMVSFAQFLLSLSVGMVCLGQIVSICDAVNMKTLDSKGISAMISLLMAVLSGNVIPLTLFPGAVQQWIRCQPFAQALDAPIRMYLAQQSAGEWLLNMGVQLLWTAALTVLARFLWKRQLGRMMVQGG